MFKAELRVAEVDPRFEICRDAIAVSILKNTLPILHTWQLAVSNEYMFALSGKFSLDM